jgi:hypothetical protein
VAILLGRRPGREADAEQAYRDAAAGGNPDAVCALALWLGEQGRQAEADRIHRFGIDAYGRTVEADPH